MNEPQKHEAKKREPLYTRSYCQKCGVVLFMVWLEHLKRKRCTVCLTEYVLAGNEWVRVDGQQGVLL